MRFEVIFCDEVRLEFNGKHFLIGVYPADLVPALMPATLSLALWIRVYDYRVPAPKVAHITIVPPGGSPSVGLDLQVDGNRDDPKGPMVLATSRFMVETATYGDIDVFVAFDDEQRNLAGTLPVAPSR